MGIKREAACLSAGPAGTDSINSSEGLALRSHSAMVPHSDHLHLWHQHTAFSYIHPTIEHTGHGGRWGMVRQQRRQFMWKTASSGGWTVVLLRKIDITGQLQRSCFLRTVAIFAAGNQGDDLENVLLRKQVLESPVWGFLLTVSIYFHIVHKLNHAVQTKGAWTCARCRMHTAHCKMSFC